MNDEVIIEYDQPDTGSENGIIVPHDRIQPETLRRLVEEFVTREWSELADGTYTLEMKVKQVLQQLREGKVVVVFDTLSQTCNIILAMDVKSSTL